MRKFGRWDKALLILGLTLAAGCGEEDPSTPPSNVIVPESWRGLWRITYSAYVCESDSLIDVAVDTRPACPGQTLEEFLGIIDQEIQLSCTGEFTDADLMAHCSGNTDIVCEVFFTADLTATRVDSLFSGSATLTTTLVCGSDRETGCETYSIEGARIDPTPAACDSVVSPAPIFSPILRRAHSGS